jgi:hypothetical protein
VGARGGGGGTGAGRPWGGGTGGGASGLAALGGQAARPTPPGQHWGPGHQRCPSAAHLAVEEADELGVLLAGAAGDEHANSLLMGPTAGHEQRAQRGRRA